MDENLKENQAETPEQTPAEPARRFRGLYEHVHISVKALDYVIIACVAVIIIAMFIGLRDPGYYVEFDSRGGTPVESVKVNYGELIPEPEPPTREGFRFIGWFRDTGLKEPWTFATDSTGGNLKLFAGWAEK